MVKAELTPCSASPAFNGIVKFIWLKRSTINHNQVYGRPTSIHQVQKRTLLLHLSGIDKAPTLTDTRPHKSRIRQQDNHLWLVSSNEAICLILICPFEVEYSGLSPATEREIFQRVQLGMPLTTLVALCSLLSFAQHFIQSGKACGSKLPMG